MADNLYSKLCSYENLLLAFKKARKGKTTKNYVIEFEKSLNENLLQLQAELYLHSYKPKPLQTFILRDPKTRKISKSAFLDRIVHHALCNIITPIFERNFIYDSFANQIGKGAFKAIERFENFQRKISNNYTSQAFVLKADIRKYFDNVDHNILLSIIKTKISDQKILWLIKTILTNYKVNEERKGMPLGNLTSQFFANVYLNELDQFVKHKLKAKYYIRYVDDFILLEKSCVKTESYKQQINDFLDKHLKLELHPEKSKILSLNRGTEFLGMKICFNYKLIKRKNLRKFQRKIKILISQFEEKLTNYDQIYDFLEGWTAYAKNANTYKLRCKILKSIGHHFISEISLKEIAKSKKLLSKLNFSQQNTSNNSSN